MWWIGRVGRGSRRRISEESCGSCVIRVDFLRTWSCLSLSLSFSLMGFLHIVENMLHQLIGGILRKDGEKWEADGIEF